MLIKKGIELLHIPRIDNTEMAGTLRNTHASENTVSERRKNLRVRTLFCLQQHSSGTLSVRELSGSGRFLLTELRVTEGYVHTRQNQYT